MSVYNICNVGVHGGVAVNDGKSGFSLSEEQRTMKETAARYVLELSGRELKQRPQYLYKE